MNLRKTCIYLSLAILPLICCVSSTTYASFENCIPDGENGHWELVDTQDPHAWDNIFIDNVYAGNNKYSVDWCGWKNNKDKECENHCRGSSSSFGTSFTRPPGYEDWSECQPESARIYRWVCGEVEEPCIACNLEKECPEV